MAKKKSQKTMTERVATMQRTGTSPYTTTPVALLIGPGAKEYHVAPGLLQNPDWIRSASFGSIELPDIEEDTGHLLVHFLYTGNYQTLYNIEVSPEDEARVEFKRAFSTLAAATTYELAGLQLLAMHSMRQYGQNMTIFDIIDAIDEEFSRLSDVPHDFQEYLTTKAREAFQKGHNDIYDNGIFDRITNVNLGRTFAKCVMELYNDKITHMLQAERLMYQILARHEVMTDGDMVGKNKTNGEQDASRVISKSKKVQLNQVLETSGFLASDNAMQEGAVSLRNNESSVSDFPGDDGTIDANGDGSGSGNHGHDGRNGWNYDEELRKIKDMIKEDNDTSAGAALSNDSRDASVQTKEVKTSAEEPSEPGNTVKKPLDPLAGLTKKQRKQLAKKINQEVRARAIEFVATEPASSGL